MRANPSRTMGGIKHTALIVEMDVYFTPKDLLHALIYKSSTIAIFWRA